MKSQRTQSERTAATRAALVAAARPLFAERGFADVGTEEVARAAGVTRGALYHQFGGLTELFAAVFEQVETELLDRIGARLEASVDAGPRDLVAAGVDAWLVECRDPEVQRIALLEAPVVLGWERWREVGRRYGVGLLEATIAGLVADGAVAALPTLPAAHVLAAALEEAVLYVSRSDDPASAEAEVRDVVLRLLDGVLTVPAAPA